MRPMIASSCSSACSWVIFSFDTSLSTLAFVSSRALSRPWSTNSCLTSLRTTGMSAAAITWAISPPIVPAPTTAALNTNKFPPIFDGRGRSPREPRERTGGAWRLAAGLGRQENKRPLQGRLHLRADEEDVADPAEDALGCELVAHLQGHRGRLLRSGEGGEELALHRRV